MWAYLSLGRAEDPPFTIKQMVVVVDWPGASPDEMAREVIDPIERKLEDLAHLDYTQSQTQPGQTESGQPGQSLGGFSEPGLMGQISWHLASLRLAIHRRTPMRSHHGR